MLPPGFRYEPESVSGSLTATNPEIINPSDSNGRQQLNWFWGSGEEVQFAPGETHIVTFGATRTRETNMYWNQAWAFFRRSDADDTNDAESERFTNDWPSSVIVVKNRYIMDVDGQVIGEYWEINNDASFKPK